MKMPICKYCNIPLKIKGRYAGFRCICDDETRFIPKPFKHENVIFLHTDDDREEVSKLFITDFLTRSVILVE